MKGIALRFFENFAPEDGTIAEHQKIINKKGYVYYGKMGSPVSDANINMLMSQEERRLLLIHSGKTERYWATFDKIIKEQPAFEDFPEYYHNIAYNFKTWFRITKIEIAPRDVMGKCKVVSSGAILGAVSKHSMSPFFIIEY